MCGFQEISAMDQLMDIWDLPDGFWDIILFLLSLNFLYMLAYVAMFNADGINVSI